MIVKIIAIANQKGGVGKTTTTANLGTGLSRIMNMYKGEKNQPTIDSALIGFKVVLPNKNYEAFKEIKKPWLSADYSEKVTEREFDVLKLLMINPEYTSIVLAEKLNVSRKTISSRIKSLKDKKVIECVGSDTKGYWKINKK